MRRPQRSYISAEGWERFVADYFRNRVLAIEVIDPAPWRHPWWSDLSWSTEREQWIARINPGYCLSGSGADPFAVVPEVFAGEETLDRLGITKPGEHPIEVPLSERPDVPLPAERWRAIGTDAAAVSGLPVEAVPAQFSERGVLGPIVLDRGDVAGAVQRVSGSLEDRREARLLRACDLVLVHERPRTVVSSAFEVTGLTVDVAQAAVTRRRGAFVEIQTKYEPASPAPFLEMLAGAASDPGRDELHLATYYLLSPAGQDPGSEPDETWAASVVYRRTWNLQYRSTYDDTPVQPTRLTLALPQLGLGVLGLRAQPIVDEINRRNAEIEAALRQVENYGVFSLA